MKYLPEHHLESLPVFMIPTKMKMQGIGEELVAHVEPQMP